VESVIARNSGDNELTHELTVGLAHQLVELGYMKMENYPLFNRTVRSFRDVCKCVETGECRASVNGRELDSKSQRQYQEAIAELSKRLATIDDIEGER